MTDIRSAFQSGAIGRLKLPNRIIRSATFEALATEKGRPTLELLNIYKTLASGGVGMLISSCVLVDPRGRHHASMLSLAEDSQQRGIARVVDVCHKAGVPLCVQLIHAGGRADPDLTRTPVDSASSATVADIDRIIENFTKAAIRAVNAGADAVEFHAAGRYFLAELLAPRMNSRTDVFGGSSRGRAEVLRRIISSVRRAVPKDFPLLVKINGISRGSQRLPIEDALVVGQMARDAGAQALEVLSGVLPARIRPDIEFLKALSTAKCIPIISSGAFHTLPEIDEALTTNLCDFVGLSRALIREPDLVKKYAEGKCEKPACIRCNQCLKETSGSERPLRCFLLDLPKRRDER